MKTQMLQQIDLHCETPIQKSLMKLAVIINFNHRRPYRAQTRDISILAQHHRSLGHEVQPSKCLWISCKEEYLVMNTVETCYLRPLGEKKTSPKNVQVIQSLNNYYIYIYFFFYLRHH